jgi:hypothetical protein
MLTAFRCAPVLFWPPCLLFKGVRSSCCDILEPQCLMFALVLIGNGFASSVWHLRPSRRLFVSPVAYLVGLDHLDHQHEINLDHYRR